MTALIIVSIAVFLAVISIAVAAFVYLYFCMIKMFKRVMDDTLKGMATKAFRGSQITKKLKHRSRHFSSPNKSKQLIIP